MSLLSWLVTRTIRKPEAAGSTKRGCSCGHALCHYRICTDYAVIANRDLAYNLGPSSYQYIITDNCRSPGSTPITDSNPLIQGAVLAQFNSGMKDNAAEVIDTESLANFAGSGNRYAGGNLDEAFTDKTEWLSGKPLALQPVEQTIDKNRLEALREQSCYKRSKRWYTGMAETCEVCFYDIKHAYRPGKVYLHLNQPHSAIQQNILHY